jgi:hypothetical protein
MFRAEIQAIIDQCRAARAKSVTPELINDGLLREAVQNTLSRINAQAFLDWVKDDRELSYFYYDVQESGVCAKPREVAALVLEHIALDALEKDAPDA